MGRRGGCLEESAARPSPSRRGVVHGSVHDPRLDRVAGPHDAEPRARRKSPRRGADGRHRRRPGAGAGVPRRRVGSDHRVGIHRRGVVRPRRHRRACPSRRRARPAHPGGLGRRGPRARRRQRDVDPRRRCAHRADRSQPGVAAEGEPHAGCARAGLRARTRPARGGRSAAHRAGRWRGGRLPLTP